MNTYQAQCCEYELGCRQRLTRLREGTSKEHCCAVVNVPGVQRTALLMGLTLQLCFGNLSEMFLALLLKLSSYDGL